MIGQVKWFSESKGFGFIQCDKVDYFVHYSAIQGSGFKNLTEGQKVEFKPSKGSKGPQAEEVKAI